MKVINIEDLKTIYQTLLGNDFDVQINANIDYTKSQMQVSIYPTRRPYKVKDINSEVIEVYIEVYMPVDKIAEKNAILNHINSSINGLKEGNFRSFNEDWSYCSTLDFTRPLMPPAVDSGKIMQLVSLQGQILVSASDGAMLLNDISCNLSFTEIDTNGQEIITTGELKLLNDTLQLSNEPEGVLLCNEEYAGAYNRTQSGTRNMSILLMNNSLFKRLILAMEKIQPFEKNQIFKLTTYYKKFDLTIEQAFILTSLSRTGLAGAFTQMTLTFMPASSILEEGVNE